MSVFPRAAQAALLCSCLAVFGCASHAGPIRSSLDDDVIRTQIDEEAEAKAFQTPAVEGAAETAPPSVGTVQPTECRAAILVYHHLEPHVGWESGAKRAMTVSPKEFARQMAHLRDGGFAVVPFGAVADCLTKASPLPEKAVVITFDDGWESPYKNALPVLEGYGMTATFFVVTDMLGDGKVLLSWDQVRGLDRKGMTIASHSRHHPFLTRVWGPRLTDEVSGSKRILEKFLGHPVRYFAYPFGQYDARVVQAVRDAGYEAARGTWDGTRHRPADLLVLKAVYASEDHAAFVRDVAR